MSATLTGFSARCCDNDYLNRDSYSEHMKAEHPRGLTTPYYSGRFNRDNPNPQGICHTPSTLREGLRLPARLGTSPLTAAEKQWLGKRVILDDGRAGHVWSLVGPSYVLADPERNIPGARWRRKRVTPVTPYGKPADIAVVVDGELVLARTDQTVFAPPSWGVAVECQINL